MISYPSIQNVFNGLRLKPISHITVCFLAALFFAHCGCSSKPKPLRRTVQTKRVEQSDLDRAVELIDQLGEFETHQTARRSLYYLNRWSNEHPWQQDWSPDSMSARIPRAIRQLGVIDEMSRKSFTLEDVFYFQESIWLRDLSNWIVRQEADEEFLSWINETQKTLDPEQRQQLAQAQQLFDWTVRNILLDQLLPYPQDAAAAPQSSQQNTPQANELPFPLMGIPGPGYKQFPRQTLMFGHGDARERARVFILLARKQGIDVVMLSYEDGRSVRLQPWLPAVLLGDQLYLFDASLGLMIPGPDGRGVATLEQAISDEKILLNLDVNDLIYPVQQEYLGSVVGLIEASKEALSRRMQAAQNNLLGEKQISLSIQPSLLAERLRKCKGINNVSLWASTFEIPLFQSYLKELKQEVSRGSGFPASPYTPYYQFIMRDEAFYEDDSPLARGRQEHLRGRFGASNSQSSEEEEESSSARNKGAKSWYSESRVPNDIINRLELSEQAQNAVGLKRFEHESSENWERRVMSAKIVFQQTKPRSSYWIGLIHFETKDYQSAENWLRLRTMEAFPQHVWAQGARYNLARVYESQEKWEEALRLYQQSSNDQKHGDLLRAKWLAKRHGIDLAELIKAEAASKENTEEASGEK